MSGLESWKDDGLRTTIDDVFLSLDLPREWSILDVACGVGNIGQRLRDEGYNTVHGLDPVKGYLEAAGSIYSKTYKEFIDEGSPTSILEGSYDVCICGAGFFHGLIPLGGLRELLRLTKAKGFVIWSVSLEKESSVPADEHYDFVRTMEKDGICEILHRIWVKKLAFTDSGAAYLSGYVSSGIEAQGAVYIIKKN